MSEHYLLGVVVACLSLLPDTGSDDILAVLIMTNDGILLNTFLSLLTCLSIINYYLRCWMENENRIIWYSISKWKSEDTLLPDRHSGGW